MPFDLFSTTFNSCNMNALPKWVKQWILWYAGTNNASQIQQSNLINTNHPYGICVICGVYFVEGFFSLCCRCCCCVGLSRIVFITKHSKIQTISRFCQWMSRPTMKEKKNYKHAYKLIEKKKMKALKIVRVNEPHHFHACCRFQFTVYSFCLLVSCSLFPVSWLCQFFLLHKMLSGGFPLFLSLNCYGYHFYFYYSLFICVLMTFIFVYWMANWFTCSNSIRAHTQSTNLSRLIGPFQMDAKDEMGINDRAKNEMRKWDC